MQHDAAIVGGPFAGLAAAAYFTRARRRACVIDARQPRNRFADASHGFLGSDGSNRLTILAKARLAAYPTVTMIEVEATGARRFEAGFAVVPSTGEEIAARKAIRSDADKMTTESGHDAARDIARAHSVSWVVADDVPAGTAAHRSCSAKRRN